jgi:hypothetical protein
VGRRRENIMGATSKALGNSTNIPITDIERATVYPDKPFNLGFDE